MTSTERREARYERRKAQREMKRIAKFKPYDDFSQVIDVDNLYAAFRSSMRGVAWKESVQRFEANALRNIADTRRKLLTGENIQHGFVEFDLHERGKIRHIKSIHISERIVQKSLCDNVLTPILTNPLIYDNGASVKGKGVHFAIRRLITHLSKYYRRNGFSNEGYALLIDFTKFFDNIRHDILFTLVERYITDPQIRDLMRRFVSVFGPGKSLGLGSQVSQIAAIFYPDKLDHVIKEKLHIEFYGRYMDDLYLVHDDKDYLRHCLAEIKKVCAALEIVVNKKKTRIVKLSSGVNFLKGKYKLLPSGKVLRLPGKDSTKRMRRKLKKFKPLIKAGKMSFADLRTAYQSWRGSYIKRFNAYYRTGYMDKLYNELFVNLHNL
jgi:retron-type reverse transcriptase